MGTWQLEMKDTAERTMSISRAIRFCHNRLQGMQSTDAITALHPFIDAGTKRLGFFGSIKRVLCGIRLASGSKQGSLITNRSTGWRQIMLTFMPSMGVGLVGSLLTAIALAADWYIWKFRYWASSASSAPSAKDKSVIHASSASGRELVVSPAPGRPEHPHRATTESEWLNVGEWD
jgi:hypothetical protein